MGTVGYAVFAFGEFYHPPAFSRFGAADAGEDVLLAAYELAMDGNFGAYRLFAGAAGLASAALLGAVSGLFGLWQKSLPHGAAALLAGAATTIAAFTLIPTMWFPLDRYPPGALWVMGGDVLLAAAVWVLVTFIGRILQRARYQRS